MKLPELSSWERIKRSGLPVVIYGMGNGADMIIDEFCRLGVPVKGVTASDSFVRGQYFRGFEVRRLSSFEGDFILVPAFGSSRPEVVDHIINLSHQYNVIFAVVPVCGKEIFNREFVEMNIDRIEKAQSLFKGKSSDIYEKCVRFVFGGDLTDLLSAESDKSEIFENFLQLNDNEVYLDLGAYRGDTVLEFLSYTSGKYKEIIAVEPDRKTFLKLSDNLSSMKNCTAVNKAIGSTCETVLFSDAAGRQSSVSSSGNPVDCTTVDCLCSDVRVSYIKADVEGSEMPMIEGAKNTILKYKPKLNIALYHRSADIFDIPLLINEINPEYNFEIRKHPGFPCWDMNLYCN